MPDNKPSLTEEEQRQYVEALETLPLLTRAVFLLAFATISLTRKSAGDAGSASRRSECAWPTLCLQ